MLLRPYEGHETDKHDLPSMIPGPVASRRLEIGEDEARKLTTQPPLLYLLLLFIQLHLVIGLFIPRCVWFSVCLVFIYSFIHVCKRLFYSLVHSFTHLFMHLSHRLVCCSIHKGVNGSFWEENVFNFFIGLYSFSCVYLFVATSVTYFALLFCRLPYLSLFPSFSLHRFLFTLLFSCVVFFSLIISFNIFFYYIVFFCYFLHTVFFIFILFSCMIFF